MTESGSGDTAGGRRRWRRTAAVAGVVLAASLVPSPGDLPVPSPLGVVGLDAWLHAAGYAVLAVTAVADAPRRDARTLVTVFVGAVGFGFGVELLQHAVPGRQFAASDAAANAVGAAAGLAVAVLRHGLQGTSPSA